MAKSFHTILSGTKIDVEHKGPSGMVEKVTLDLPKWVHGVKGILMDEAKLVAWAQENKIVHGLLHTGLQKMIIDMRAKARPSTNGTTGKTTSILDDRDKAQQRLNDFVVKPTLPPGQGGKTMAFEKGEKSALTAAIEALKMAAMDDEQILNTLSVKFDRAKVEKIIEELAEVEAGQIRVEEGRHER